MGWRFHRRLQVIPGIRLNVGTRGTSVSFGHRGAWLTVGAHGRRRATLGWPGTGLSYSASLPAQRQPKAAPSALAGLVLVAIVLVVVLVIAQR